jgi:hypothetical protein
MTVETAVQIAFQVFNTKAQGPFLSWCLVPNAFAVPNFSDRAGVQFGSSNELVEALDEAGLPGLKISTALDGERYAVGVSALRKLGIHV